MSDAEALYISDWPPLVSLQEIVFQLLSWAAAVAFLYNMLKAPALCDDSVMSFEVAAFLLLLQVRKSANHVQYVPLPFVLSRRRRCLTL